MKIDLDQIRDLIAVVSDSSVAEFSIESGDEKITIKKAQQALAQMVVDVPFAQAGSPPPASIPPLNGAKPETPPPSQETDNGNNAEGYLPITSPMVGTFYRASSPTSAPFIEVGDVVGIGQTVCIIEAMKLMNDLQAEISGRVVKICAENGSTVEYGQPLFMVNPKG